jgi:hypothetical protein
LNLYNKCGRRELILLSFNGHIKDIRNKLRNFEWVFLFLQLLIDFICINKIIKDAFNLRVSYIDAKSIDEWKKNANEKEFALLF